MYHSTLQKHYRHYPTQNMSEVLLLKDWDLLVDGASRSEAPDSFTVEGAAASSELF